MRVSHIWVPHSRKTSASPANRSRVAYLEDWFSDDVLDRFIRNELERDPRAEDITRRVLGHFAPVIRRRTAKEKRSIDRVKQDVGLRVAIRLVDIYGSARVETLRKSPAGPPKQVRLGPRERKGPLSYVASYTPLRVRAGRAAETEEQRGDAFIRLLGSCPELSDLHLEREADHDDAREVGF